MFGGMYGDAAEASGFVSAENTIEILLTCLRRADKALLYVKTTQNTPTPHNAAAKKDNSGGNNNSGTPKRPRMCRYCALPVTSHSHVLECEKFENVPRKVLINFCHHLSACVSCLQVDQAMDWSNRAAWFTAHKPSCNRDFICRVGDCNSKPPISQAHVVVCYEHHADNQTRIDDYKKTNAAYAKLQLYCTSAASKKPDEPAIFNHVGGG